MSDLRTFLDDEAPHVWRPEGTVSLVQEITALQQALDARQQYPVIEIAQPQGADGTTNPIPVVCNLTASRELTARALGVQDHRDFAATYAQRTANPILRSASNEMTRRYSRSYCKGMRHRFWIFRS